MTWKRVVFALLALLVGGMLFLSGLVVGVLISGWDYRASRPGPPAPSAPKAPGWKQRSEDPGASGNSSANSSGNSSANSSGKTTSPKPPTLHDGGPNGADSDRAPDAATWDPDGNTAAEPAYQWPDDFKLPLKIVIDVPELPEELREPSVPPEEP